MDWDVDLYFLKKTVFSALYFVYDASCQLSLTNIYKTHIDGTRIIHVAQNINTVKFAYNGLIGTMKICSL